jgi:hypothetical protein
VREGQHFGRDLEVCVVVQDRHSVFEGWAEALQATLGEDGMGTWSFHVAVGGWITTVVDPPEARFPPRRIARRPPAELLDRGWLADQN